MHISYPVARQTQRLSTLNGEQQQKLPSLLGPFPNHASGLSSNSGSTEHLGGVSLKIPARPNCVWPFKGTPCPAPLAGDGRRMGAETYSLTIHFWDKTCIGFSAPDMSLNPYPNTCLHINNVGESGFVN